ncbi:MAG: alpha/beta hydrolase [Bacteroidales bacterium]|nr:alpha/beta hydrolase [Bacteroidales bacterium]
MKKYLAWLIGLMASQVSAGDYESREISVTTSDGIELGATLTLPHKPKAAILLITGSGVQNRDEEIMGKTPFKTLAGALGEAGFAVLRVDDRGYANSADAEGITIDTDMEDSRAALAKLDSLIPGVKKGLIGHSSGGTVAIRLGATDTRADFIITLAAPAWKGDSLLMAQSRALATAMTGKWDQEALQRELVSIAASNTPTALARPTLMAIMSRELGVAATMPQVKAQIEVQINGILSPWMRSMLRYDPAEDIKNIRIPFLALNGTKDLQVPVANLKTFKTLNPMAETIELEDHNHLFQKSQTGLPQEYAILEGDLSTETLSTIVEWVVKLIK